MASKYDNFLTEIKEINQQNRKLLLNMKNCEDNANKIGNQQTTTEKQLQELEQYGRRENLEVKGEYSVKKCKKMIKDIKILEFPTVPPLHMM